MVTIVLFTALSLPAAATDYVVTYDGTAAPTPIHGYLSDQIGTGDPVFERPDAGPLTGMSACLDPHDGGNFRYETITFTNDSDYEITVDVDVSNGICNVTHDSMVFGYTPSFDANNPIANCFAAQDDSGDGGTCSLFVSPVFAHESNVYVITSYGANQLWPWTATFTVHDLFQDDFECASADDFNCQD